MIDQDVRGFILPNSIIDELLPELSHSELKCYLCVLRKTKGWNKEEDAISVTQFMKVTGLSNKAVISACESLVEREILERKSGDRNTGIYSIKTYKSATSEKGSPVKNFPSTSEKSSQITSEKSSHTINNIKNNIQNITPLSPYGESANAEHADEKTKTSKREKISVDYQGVMNAWNEVFNGSPIHLLKTLSHERKKAILKVAKTMLETKDVESCSVEVFKEYFKDFLNQANSRANKFFFGGLDGSGWIAKFDYIMRPKTFLNTFEDSL